MTTETPRAAPQLGAGDVSVVLRKGVEAALAAGDARRAALLLAELWRKQPGPALAGFVVSRFERLAEALKPARARVALLRSGTLEAAVPVLRAGAFTSNIALEVQVGDFNAYAQEILNPSSPLYSFAPDIVLLVVHTADIAPELWDGFADLAPGAAAAVADRVSAEFERLLAAFRERSTAHLVVHTLELPVGLAHGVFDAQLEASQAEALRSINRRLRLAAAQYKGVYLLDYDALVARHGRQTWHDPRKWLTLRMPLRAERLNALAEEWLRFVHPLLGRVSKALVLDLDNTLWGGVVGEDGPTGVKLGREYPGGAFLALQRVILDLYQRGIILAIASKNNLADALEVLEQHPDMLLRPRHFAALRVNWDDKVTSLRSIAAELNIGLDALAFLDDNPAEREIVRLHAPEVAVIEISSDPTSYAQALRDSPLFERLAMSAEDRERGRYYAEERQRSELQQRSGSLEDFYRSLEIKVTIGRATAATIARVSQLTQKTNQFNLTTRRYSEQQIAELAADPSAAVYTVSTQDRFGDNGLVGVAIAKFVGEECELDSFLLSCRVIGRTIETALTAAIANEARARGKSRLRGIFIPTKKNAPSRDFFAQHGFAQAGETGGESSWVLELATTTIACPPWIDCHVEENETR
jgi:FkbH-like protein